MQISVIIPTFNRPPLLKNCLVALLKQQTEIDFEVIVVSDGPDRNTAGLTDSFRSERLRHLSLDRQRGPAAARNYGVARSKSNVLVFTDDDTIPDPRWLSDYWASYKRHELALVAFAGKVQVPVSAEPTDYELNVAGLEAAEFVTANCAITKKAFRLCGGFDESFTMAWREDSDLHFKLIKSGVPLIRSEAMVVHPVRKSSWDVSLRSEKKTMFDVLLFKRHPLLYAKYVGRTPIWNYYAMLFFACAALVGLLLKNKIIFVLGALLWLVLVVAFASKRLRYTRKSARHILQMLATSVLIPFYSIFWKVYGSIKFRKLLL